MADLFRKKTLQTLIEQAESNPHTAEGEGGEGTPRLRKSLNVWDLTALGIAAIIGAGIFSAIGEASFHGGPAVIFLFMFVAVACGFSALCYAEFSSAIPVSGSAYTYAYVAFGEIIAWTIGWDLIIEYAIGNIVVAISWSNYFVELMEGIGWHIPECFTTDYYTAYKLYPEALQRIQSGIPLNELKLELKESYLAWLSAPQIGSFRLIADIPALLIVLLITILVFIGIRESKRVSNAMVILKIGIILFIIAIGSFFVTPSNWSPFAPNGFSGVMKGVAAVFFAFIGFDALSTTSEECNNPRRDLPRAIIISLGICTVLFVAVALTLTGLVSYKELQVGDPLAYAFKHAPNMPEFFRNWISGIIAVSAVIAMASVLLVFQMGQPRIWMSMSRDGLLPKIFSYIHPKFYTPWFATIVTGIVVGIPCLLMNLSEVTSLSAIGTLFAFALVCAGILKLHVQNDPHYQPSFRVPYFNAQYIIPIGYMIAWFGVIKYNPGFINEVFTLSMSLIPKYIFISGSLLIVILSYLYKLSLIPVLGLLSCLYLMSEIDHHSWYRFLIWLAIGQVIYFLYSRSHSLLNKSPNS